jgi:hypothetical protein
MKLYPKHEFPKDSEESGFTAEEIRRGIHCLYADVKCTKCNKVQPLAVTGSIDNGKCIKCKGITI